MQDMITEFVEIKVDQKMNALIVKFLDFIPGNNMVKIFEYEFKLIEHYSLKKCFIDLRMLPAYGKGVKEFVKDVWFPTVKNLGVRHISFAVPEAVLGEMAMRDAHKEAEFHKPIVVKHFKNSEEALEWLSGC